MEIKMVKIADIVPYENNPRHNADAVQPVAESIKRYGFKVPMILDSENVIVAGHTRYEAAQTLGMDEVPVIYADDLTEEQVREFRLVDNKTAEFAEWDFTKLEEELSEIDFGDFDFGFDVDDDSSEDLQAVDDGYEAEPPVEPRSKVGDLYQLGNHRLICGDCTDENIIKKLMGNNMADIAITSPPYGESDSAKLRDHYVKGNDKRKSLYNQHEDKTDEWAQLIRGAYTSMRSASVAQFINIQMLAANKKELFSFVNDNIDSLCDVIVWDKKKAPPQMQSSILNNQFEFIFVLSNENNSRTIPFSDFHGNRNNIIELSCGRNEFADLHRAVYPVELPAEILNIANKAQSVLDVFGGTGTTMIACEQLNRKCYMCELDPVYVDVIIDRWEKLTGNKAVLLS